MTLVRRRNYRLDCEALESKQLLAGFYIVNAASGQVLNNEFSNSIGAAIQQFQLYGGTTQRWDRRAQPAVVVRPTGRRQ
jgi:hypothetical protein